MTAAVQAEIDTINRQFMDGDEAHELGAYHDSRSGRRVGPREIHRPMEENRCRMALALGHVE